MKKLKLSLLFVATVMVVQFFTDSIPVSAKKDSYFYSLNDISYYDPDAINCSSGEVSLTTSIEITKNATTDTIYNYLTKTPLSSNSDKPLSGAQVAGIMGNMYAESGFNTAAIEKTQKPTAEKDRGHGLVQWTFSRWTALENYAKLKGKDWTDLTTQLEYLKTELEGSEKKVITDAEFADAKSPAVAAMRFRVVFERADPKVAHDDKREGAAISIYSQYGGSLDSAASCATGDGVVAGNLVKTAISWALEKPASEGMNKESDARDTYRIAKPKYNPSVHWTDCGGFIAAVMYATKVDPNYPNVSTLKQKAYVKSHPDKYVIISKPTKDDLQPGDILITDDHTTMYTGEATYPSVDASYWNDVPSAGRVPSVRTSGSASYMISHGAILARVIK